MKKRIRDMENIDRPREKLMRYGAARLTNAELLAIVLRTGTKTKNAVQLAKEVLRVFPEHALAGTERAELKKISGIGTVKACEISAVFELGRRVLQEKRRAVLLSPKDVWEAMADIRASKKEHFVVFYLDARSQETKREIISVGTLTESLVHPREVFEGAIRCNAASILVAHNHPSGNTEPSDADRAVTRKLFEAGRILDIRLVDHVIVTKDVWRSVERD